LGTDGTSGFLRATCNKSFKSSQAERKTIGAMYYKTLALSSTGSLSSFPGNKPTEFTNILGETLSSSDRQKSLFVKLRAISLSTDVFTAYNYQLVADTWSFLKPAWQYPGYVEIFLEEATAQINANKYAKLLGGFAFPPEDFTTPKFAQKRLANYGRHVFKDSGWVKLNSTTVTKFTVKLDSVTGAPLILVNPLWTVYDAGDTPPTIVELDVTDNEEMATNEGTITLGCSSWHPELYPANSHADFRSPLPRHMSFPNHEVALARIVFPANLRQSMKMRFWIENTEFVFDALRDFEFRESFLPKAINAAISNSPYRGHITFHMDRRTLGRMRGRFGRGRSRQMRNATIRITLDKYFQQLFNLYEEGKAVHYMQPGQPAELDGNRPPTFRFVVLNPTALLECEQVSHSLVAQNQYRMLQYVPVLATETPINTVGRDSLADWNEGDWEAVRELVYEPPELHWVDFTNTPIDSIKFTFREPATGEIKSLNAGDGPNDAMIITLRLRPKRNLTHVPSE
jgi:hypothetical protein